MMKMLEAGGLPVLTDNQRTADEDNPNGYYELEAVKRTRDDSSWLDGANGRAVKMVYCLIRDLPADRNYKVVLMRRQLDEVLMSQAVMLERLGRPAPLDDDCMKQLFQRELASFEEWAGRQSHIELFDVDFRSLVENPRPAIESINQFLGGSLDTSAMTAVVDPKLYRRRAA